MSSSFDVDHRPATRFEHTLFELLNLCTELVKDLDNNEHGTREIKAGLQYYNTAFKSTMSKSAITHEMHIPAFAKFIDFIPSKHDDLVSLEWLRPEQSALYLKFVKQDHSYADKVMLNLTGIYGGCRDESEEYNFASLLLRCCELATPDYARQAIYGRAAYECELASESTASPEEEEEMGGGIQAGIQQFKKVMLNKEIWQTVMNEGMSAIDQARRNPTAVATLQALESENNSFDDKINAVKNLVSDIPSITQPK